MKSKFIVKTNEMYLRTGVNGAYILTNKQSQAKLWSSKETAKKGIERAIDEADCVTNPMYGKSFYTNEDRQRARQYVQLLKSPKLVIQEIKLTIGS